MRASKRDPRDLTRPKKRKRTCARLICLVYVCVCLIPPASAQYVTFTPEGFENETRSISLATWRVRIGDDMAWASPSYDDSSWEVRSVWSEPESRQVGLLGWEGVGWARIHLTLSPAILNRPVALYIRQHGASEIYLNGERIHQLGRIGEDGEELDAAVMKSIRFSGNTHQVIAVRFSSTTFNEIGTGFQITIFEDSDHTLAQEVRRLRRETSEQMFFTGILLAFAILHLFLFLFNRDLKSNLYFTVYTAFFAATSYVEYTSARLVHRLLVVFLVLSGLRFIYALVYQKLPRRFFIWMVLGGGLVVWALRDYVSAFTPVRAFTLLILVEALRVIAVAIKRRQGGIWIIGVGNLPLVVMAIYEVLMDFRVFSPVITGTFNPTFYGALFPLISMSVYLARDFAATHRRLRARTEELHRLNVELETRVRERTIQLEKRNEFIRDVFGRYVTDEIVANLLESPEGLKVGGETRKVTILLSDLRGFTPLSEALPPEKVVSLINSYLSAMTDVIMDHGGTIDEFLGDGILVIFGAPILRPDDALRAVGCAVEMQSALKAVNRQNRERGLPEIAMGIGINTGEVVVGNIGSERRAKYGVVGSAVNLAARIESCTSGGQILISDTTLRDADSAVQVSQSMQIHPKGFTEMITVHEVCGLAAMSSER